MDNKKITNELIKQSYDLITKAQETLTKLHEITNGFYSTPKNSLKQCPQCAYGYYTLPGKTMHQCDDCGALIQLPDDLYG